MMANIAPYMYEPTRPDDEEKVDCNLVNRLTSDVLEWCKCMKCVKMTNASECYCCWESEAFNRLRGENDCKEFHESFDFLMLNMDSLKTAKYHLSLRADATRRKLLGLENNTVWRHVAYTQFIY